MRERRSYFAPFLASIDNEIRQDGALSFNMPAGIAALEASKLYKCNTADNLKVSVGCGQMLLPNHKPTLFGRIRRYCEWKSKASSEEETRTLYDRDRQNHFRLDPELGIDTVALDDIDTMLALRSQLEQSMSRDIEFCKQLKLCAWQLTASNWYCQIAPDCGSQAKKCNSLMIEICSRNDEVSGLILKNRSDTCFFVQHTRSMIQLASPRLVFSVPLHDESLELKVELVNGKREAPISGMPMTLSRFLEINELRSLTSFCKRKNIGDIPSPRTVKQQKNSIES